MTATAHLRPPWKPGQSGNPGGKERKLFPSVAAILKSKNLEPIAELLALIPAMKESDQARIWLEILPYVHTKPKPMSDDEGDELDKMSTAELVQLVKKQLPEVG